MHVVHVDLGRGGRGVVFLDPQDYTGKRMASLLAWNECDSHHLQPTMDQGEMNAAQIKPGELLFSVNPAGLPGTRI